MSSLVARSGCCDSMAVTTATATLNSCLPLLSEGRKNRPIIYKRNKLVDRENNLENKGARTK